MGLFDKIRQSMGKTRVNVSDRIDQLVDSSPVIDEGFYDDLTDILIMADAGVRTSETIISRLREKCKAENIKTTGPAREALRSIVEGIMGSEPMRLQSPMVVPVIGVNGVGKTTSIGKLASRMKTVGRNVVLCAGDTFRAAAADQLTVWADRAGVPLVKHHEGADAAAVVFDAVQLAKGRHADVLIIDTAGRLHNKAHLMEELKKISRVVEREYPEAVIKGLLVIDATTGQNGLQQAQVFKDAAVLDGIILTKLDGTAKGGIALAIRHELGLPVRYIGIGEGLDDLEPFDAKAFVEAIF